MFPDTARPTTRRHGRPAARFALSVALALCAAGSSAHETWLLPEDFRPRATTPTIIQMTSGMAFPSPGAGIAASRITEAVLNQGNESSALVPAGATKEALQLSAILRPGVACAYVGLRSRVLEIDEEDVMHYLEEIGAGAAVLTAWDTQPAPREWRESYTKLARTYLRSEGQTDDDSCWQQASSARFEILPLADPTRLQAGDTLQLQVLFDGEPLAEQAVGLLRAGDTPRPMLRSDDEGHIAVEFTAAGTYMIYATNLRPVTGQTFNWESDFITLTLKVHDAT